jgi:hypothetical protein
MCLQMQIINNYKLTEEISMPMTIVKGNNTLAPIYLKPETKLFFYCLIIQAISLKATLS